MSYPVSGLGKPQGGGAFPLWEDVDFLGGYQVQATITSRDAIPLLNQKVGMLCYVIETVTTYRLSATGTPGTWTALPAGFTAGGDLTGSSTSQTVAKINGVALSGTPTAGYVLTATGTGAATWQAPAAGFTAGGDLTGTPTSQTVSKLQGVAISGTPATGYAIIATSGTAAAWTAPPTGTGVLHYTGGVPASSAALVDLSADVTGTLAASKQAAQGMFGDVTGTTGASVVTKVNGIAITGTPAAGYTLIATSPTAATWQTAASGFTAGGDLSGTSTSQTVAKINGVAISGTAAAGYSLIATGTAAAAWTAPAATPTGTGFTHYVSGVRDAAAKLVDLTADVTGVLPSANMASPTGTGFTHITSGTRDSAARAVDVSSADITGILKVASGGPTYQGTFTTTSSSNQTVYTWTMASASMLRLTAIVSVRAPGFSYCGFGDVTGDFLSDGTTITTISPSTVNNLATSGLVYTPPLAAFVVSGNTVSLICYGPPSHNYSWTVQIFEVGG